MTERTAKTTSRKKLRHVVSLGNVIEHYVSIFRYSYGNRKNGIGTGTGARTKSRIKASLSIKLSASNAKSKSKIIVSYINEPLSFIDFACLF